MANVGLTTDFLRDIHKAAQYVYREFTAFCRNPEHFNGDMVAICGSEFKKVNTHPGHRITKDGTSLSAEDLAETLVVEMVVGW